MSAMWIFRSLRRKQRELMEALIVGEEKSLIAGDEKSIWVKFSRCISDARTLLEERRLEEALPVIRKAIELGPDRPEGFNLLGAFDELRGDLEAARRMYRVALTIDAQYTPASVNLDRVCRWRAGGGGINFGDPIKQELTMRDLIV